MSFFEIFYKFSNILMWGLGLFVVFPLWVYLVSYMQMSGWLNAFKSTFNSNKNQSNGTKEKEQK